MIRCQHDISGGRSHRSSGQRSAAMQGTQGMTIVEILVAMSIFLIALASLTGLFISTTRTYRVTEERSVLQQETAAALNTLKYEVGLAGFRGTCKSSLGNGFSGPSFEVVRGTESDTIRVRYFEDRFPDSCGAETVVTFSIQENQDGELALHRAEDDVDEAIVEGISGLALFRYVTEDGGLTPTMPATGFVGVSIEVTFDDESFIRFIVGLKNSQFNAQES